MTNLDEFYMIRIAGLKQLFAARMAASGSDGMSPLEQLRKIKKYIKDELAIVEKHYKDALKELAQNGLFIKNYDEISPELQAKCDKYFFSNILPVIVPIAVDATHPYPTPNIKGISLSRSVLFQHHVHPIYIRIEVWVCP